MATAEKEDISENQEIEDNNNALKFDDSKEEQVSSHSHNKSKNSNNSNNNNNSSQSSFKIQTKKTSSAQMNQRYKITKSIHDTLEDDLESPNGNTQFISTGKFMQITPHFHIFDKQIDTLRESIYDGTKKCLMLKCSLQESENILKDTSNDVIKDIVTKISELRELFEKGNKGLNKTAGEVKSGLDKLTKIQGQSKQEITDCTVRIGECEKQIGYCLLGKPCYSFMEKNNITQFKDKGKNNFENNNNENIGNEEEVENDDDEENDEN